jgi:hypothetical protein
MSANNQNLTVLIKKADGSFARISIAEFEKMQADKKQGTQNQPKSVVKSEPKTVAAPTNLPVQKQEPEKRNEQKVVITVKQPLHQTARPEKPVEKTFPNISDKHEKIKIEVKSEKNVSAHPRQDNQKQKEETRIQVSQTKIDNEDARSLLEEEKPKGKLPFTSNTREKQVDEILKNLNFKISPANSNRLRTIVQLFLKDIRSEEETRETLQRKEIDGGMGLTSAQTDEVIKKTKERNVPEKIDSIVPLKTGLPINKVENERLEKEIPSVKAEVPFPAVSAPNNSFRHDPKLDQKKTPSPSKPVALKPVLSSREILDKQTTLASLEKAPIFPIKIKTEQVNPPDFKLNQNEVKIAMQDITPTHIEMGPVDELKYINLIDFRRLSSNPVDAAKRIRQKFVNLKDESIILYFEGMAAWHASPLYNDYIELASEALSKRLPLSEVCHDKKRIQLQELTAILQMEKELP